MAFAPVLAPPEDPDKAVVARALADQPFAQTTSLPPVPPPGGDLTTEQLMTAAAPEPSPLPALAPVDQELAVALPPQGAPPPPPAPVAELPPPKTPAEAAERNVAAQTALDKERIATAEETAKTDAERAAERATHDAAVAEALQKVQERQELHRQAAAARVASAREKAESEPYHTFWESRSIGQNIATGIGLILGGVSWNPAHVNRGIQLLEHAMDQDLAIQKEKHADLWRAVESAEKGQTNLDASQLRELSQFSATNGAKWDAIASRLNAAAAANKGRGDVNTIKQQALEADRKAIEFWKGAESAEATANHMEENEKIERERIAASERNAALRGKKGKGGGVGGGGGNLAALSAMDAAARQPGATLLMVAEAGQKAGMNSKSAIATAGKVMSDVRAGVKMDEGAAKQEAQDAKREVRVNGKVIGLAHTPEEAAKMTPLFTNYDQAVRSIEALVSDLKDKPILGRLPRGSKWDNAVLAIASTTTAGQTDANVKHEAGTMTNRVGLVDLHALEEKLKDLNDRKKQFSAALEPPKARPVSGGDHPDLTLKDGRRAKWNAVRGGYEAI